MCFGAQKSERAAENLLRIDEFAAYSIVLSYDTETVQHYGEIKNTLHIIGRPLPENDILIAALALQHELALITRDIHFDNIANLKIVRW